MVVELTDKQEKVLRFLFEHLRGLGRLPTMREAAKEFGFKKSSMQSYYDAFVKKGYLTRGPDRRGFEMDLEKAWEIFGIPVLGRVAAGRRAIVDGEIIDRLTPTELYPIDVDFALLVKGDSMTGIGIMPGDYVFIKETNLANPGDIVVAIIGDEDGVVKRLVEEDGERYLKSENPNHKDIPFNDVEIAGKVIARWGRMK